MQHYNFFALALKILLTNPARGAIIAKHETGKPFMRAYLGVAQLVARYLGVVEAAGSSPVTQTISSVHN